MSREGKWTKGRFVACEPVKGGLDVVIVQEETGQHIALVYGTDPHKIGLENVKLLVAAPQMAEALRRLHDAAMEKNQAGWLDLTDALIAASAALRAAGVE